MSWAVLWDECQYGSPQGTGRCGHAWTNDGQDGASRDGTRGDVLSSLDDMLEGFMFGEPGDARSPRLLRYSCRELQPRFVTCTLIPAS